MPINFLRFNFIQCLCCWYHDYRKIGDKWYKTAWHFCPELGRQGRFKLSQTWAAHNPLPHPMFADLFQRWGAVVFISIIKTNADLMVPVYSYIYIYLIWFFVIVFFQITGVIKPIYKIKKIAYILKNNPVLLYFETIHNYSKQPVNYIYWRKLYTECSSNSFPKRLRYPWSPLYYIIFDRNSLDQKLIIIILRFRRSLDVSFKECL